VSLLIFEIMGLTGIDEITLVARSSSHCRCGLKTILQLIIGNSQNDMLRVVEDYSSNDADQAIVDLLEGTGVSLASKEVELALVA